MGAVGRYIVNEVQRIYLSEGASINNKHIEMIVKQMFSRVKISDGGDAQDFVMGEIVEKSKFLEVNKEIKKAGGHQAKAEEVLGHHPYRTFRGIVPLRSVLPGYFPRARQSRDRR